MEENVKQIVDICKYVVECVVHNQYIELERKGALKRVSIEAIKRVLREYDSNQDVIMPPEQYFEELDIIEYNDQSGYCVDIDLWYVTGKSDLTLQLDIRKNGNVLINDIRVM